MPDLFGIDIAGLVNSSIQSAGGVRTGQLTRSTPGTRDPGNLTSGTQPTTQTVSFNGFVENGREVRRGGTLVREGGQFVSILGASISLTPQSGDTIVLDGTTYTVTAIEEIDPAEALYVCRVES